MRELRRRLGPWALLLIPIWVGWEVIDAWGNVAFITEGGRWDWLPETSTLTPVWRILVVLSALVIVASWLYDRYGHKPDDPPLSTPPPEPPVVPPRTGMKLRPGSSTRLGDARIRNQDVGIDLDGELTVEDLDIE